MTPTYTQAIKQPTLHYLTRSVRRRAATSKRASSDQPIAGGKPTSHLLIRGSGLDYFRVADHPPTIAGTAAHRGNPNCYKWNWPVVSARLRDDDQPVGVCVAFPGILDLGERNTLGLDAQCAAGYAVHHLLERVGEYVPRRHASGS